MKQPLIIAMLALLAVGSFWLMRDLEKDLSTDTSATPTREIAIAYDVNGRYYSAENFLQYKLTSNTVSEFSNQAGTRFQTPMSRCSQPISAWHGKGKPLTHTYLVTKTN